MVSEKTIIVSGVKNNGEIDYQEINASELSAYKANVRDIKVYDKDDGEWYINYT